MTLYSTQAHLKDGYLLSTFSYTYFCSLESFSFRFLSSVSFLYLNKYYNYNNIYNKMKSITSKVLSFLPTKDTMAAVSKSKVFMTQYKQIYQTLENEYSKYYNLNTRKKISNINAIINESQKFFMNMKKDDKENLLFSIAYGKIMNNILKNNKIIIFKYEISKETNFDQMISIFKEMTYPKGIMLTITDASFKHSKFLSILNCVLYLENIVDFSVEIEKNSFSFARNAKKYSESIKKKETSIFYFFKHLFYQTFKSFIDFFWLNYEDFGMVSNEEESKISSIKRDYVYNVGKVELNLAFGDSKVNEYTDCISYLSHSIKTNNLKIVLFKLNDFSYITEFITKIKPSYLWVIPYKDVPKEQCDPFIEKVNLNCSLIKFNIINIIAFTKDSVRKFLERQVNLEDLRITGNISGEVTETILKCYLNKEKKYAIKKISLNGRIVMNEQWKTIICDFLKLKSIEAFHIDVFFNGKEYMRDIAEAFYENNTLTSFTVRNSVRHERDVFVDVLKELLYEKNIPRKEVFTKIRLYKLL